MTSFVVKTAAQYRDDMLRSIKNGLITQVGIPNPNVSFGTDHYIIADAVGKIAELVSYNAIAAADAQMADTATGEDLARIASIYGLALKPAGGSSGNLVLSTSNPVGLITGLQLIDPNGLRYQTSVPGVYNNGDNVPITAIDTGTGTNLPQGTLLRWVSPPAFVDPNALVSTGGLTGGVEAETDEDLRSRLLSKFRNPIGGGNWSQFADIAEKSNVAVQKAYVYPAFNGPSTTQITVTGSATATNKNRDVNSLIVTGSVVPAIQANIFEGIFALVTTVNNIPSDVSIGLSLPNAPTANIPGPGGGWLDGKPWPTYAPDTFSSVQVVNSTTDFIVFSDNPPEANVSKFVFITDTWSIIHSKVIQVLAATPPTYRVVVDTPCLSISPGDWLFPDAVNIETYINALLSQYNNLGPSQIADPLTVSGIFPFAFRRPLVSESNPSDLGPSILKFIENTGDEVLDVQYLFKNPVTVPIPVNVMNGPNILVPRNIGFYPL